MDDSLIVWLDCRWIVENDNLCLEIVYWLRLSCWVNQDHSLSEIISLELLFLDHSLDCETDSLASRGFLYSNSFVVYALDLNWAKLSLLVWSKQ